jgi:metal-sulfur cluster biosynthetic enzyme
MDNPVRPEQSADNQPPATQESSSTPAPATAPESLSPEDQIKEALRAVSDPEIGLNVVQLGLIREIILNQPEPEIKMMLTTPFCPYGGWLIQQVKDTAEQAAGKTFKINVLPDMWDPNFMEDPGLLMGW